MRTGFYFRLASAGIGKNRRLYGPYLATSVGVTAMFYIVSYLSDSAFIRGSRGGGTLTGLMSFGMGVIGVFAVLFLFYTNSFLIRRRRREFGLYNMLGMDKRGIGRVLAAETVLAYLISVSGGLGLGIALSKLAELVLLRITEAAVTYDFTVSLRAVVSTAVLFAGIFFLLFLAARVGVHRSTATELMRAENVGEKPPKGNWIFGLGGVLLLGAAYGIAVSVQEPLSALLLFFLAVVMVIVATYLLFIASSVTFCRFLQRRRNYYYRPAHFVSVSSMVYRMKRNGAGLASICILATMVMVMVSVTTCMFFGSEESLRMTYPRDFIFEMHYNRWEDLSEGEIERVRAIIDGVMRSYGAAENDPIEYRYAELTGVLTDGAFNPDPAALESFHASNFDEVLHLIWVPTEDYNRQMGRGAVLAEDEAMIYPVRVKFDGDTLAFGENRYSVVEKLEGFSIGKNSLGDAIPTLVVVVNDIQRAAGAYDAFADDYGRKFVHYSWNWCFDMDIDYEKTEEMSMIFRSPDIQMEIWGGDGGEDSLLEGFTRDFRALNRAYYYSLYGGFFFLAVQLSLVFLFATVLIIYYKQISEGYEDRARFGIMRKVGMTKEEIKKSVDSQILTVFSAPLLLAALHLCFAMPMLRKMLFMFGLNNWGLLLTVTGLGLLVFVLFYGLVYLGTSRAYYRIVSEPEEGDG